MNDLPGGLINEPFVRETPLYPSNILVSDPLSAFRAEKGPFNGPQPLISCDASETTNILEYRQVQRTHGGPRAPSRTTELKKKP